MIQYYLQIIIEFAILISIPVLIIYGIVKLFKRNK